jgi:quercetin dioxygenase-like cupin family protein
MKTSQVVAQEETRAEPLLSPPVKIGRTRMHWWKLFFFALISLLVVPAARAQDPVVVDPTIAKVEFENNRIRVLRVHYEPHEKLAMHVHPAKVAVCLTNFHMHRVAPDGTASDGTCPAGTVSWREPEKHAVENLDSAPAESVEIELKFAHGPAAPVPTLPARALSEPMPSDLEPHHRPVLENQYVRVMEATIAPGDTTPYHTHSLDTLYVRLADSSVRSQPMGKPWGPTRVAKPGQVTFEHNAAHSVTHRTRNVGSTPYRALIVELLP